MQARTGSKQVANSRPAPRRQSGARVAWRVAWTSGELRIVTLSPLQSGQPAPTILEAYNDDDLITGAQCWIPIARWAGNSTFWLQSPALLRELASAFFAAAVELETAEPGRGECVELRFDRFACMVSVYDAAKAMEFVSSLEAAAAELDELLDAGAARAAIARRAEVCP